MGDSIIIESIGEELVDRDLEDRFILGYTMLRGVATGYNKLTELLANTAFSLVSLATVT